MGCLKRVPLPCETSGAARDNPVTEGKLTTDHPVLLYDGVCGLCNRLVQFVLRHDRGGVFRFASLQSGLAAGILARHGADPTVLDTFYVVVGNEGPNEVLLERSDAAMFVLRELGGIRRISAGMLRAVPRPVREWGYRLIARNRYRVFGKYESCPLPSEETRARFLGI